MVSNFLMKLYNWNKRSIVNIKKKMWTFKRMKMVLDFFRQYKISLSCLFQTVIEALDIVNLKVAPWLLSLFY